MPIVEAATGTRTLATSDGEWSLFDDAASVSPWASVGVNQVHIDTSGLAVGNYLRVRFYNVVEAGGALQVVYDTIVSRGQGSIALPAIVVLRACECTMQMTDGGSAFIRWDIVRIE